MSKPYCVVHQLHLSSLGDFQQAEIVISVCGTESYLVKSRTDEQGITREVPSWPDAVVAYMPARRMRDGVAVTKVLRLRHRSSLEPSTDDSSTVAKQRGECGTCAHWRIVGSFPSGECGRDPNCEASFRWSTDGCYEWKGR